MNLYASSDLIVDGTTYDSAVNNFKSKKLLDDGYWSVKFDGQHFCFSAEFLEAGNGVRRAWIYCKDFYLF